MAWIKKRGAVWYIGYLNEEGIKRRRATKARTGAEAQRIADELERKCERIRLGIDDGAPEPMTLRELSVKYLATVSKLQRSYSDTEGRIRLHILPVLGDKQISRIKPSDVEELLTSKAKELSLASRRHLRVHLNAMFGFAIKRLKAMRGENPVMHVPQIKVIKKSPRHLTTEQAGRLLRKSGDWQLLLLTAVFTGLRKGELMGLKWSDIHFERQIILVARSYNHDTTKGGRERPVAIHSVLLAALKAAHEKSLSPYVFPGPDGKMRTRNFNAPARLRTALKAAGIVSGYRHSCRRKGCGKKIETQVDDVLSCPDCGFRMWAEGLAAKFTFKDLRSTFGTLAYEATGNIRFVQESLGHTDVRVTEGHYSVQRPGHLLAQTELIQLSLTAGTQLAPMGNGATQTGLETTSTHPIGPEENP